MELEGIFPDLFRMQRKNLRPLDTMNLTEKQKTHCDDEGKLSQVKSTYYSDW